MRMRVVSIHPLGWRAGKDEPAHPRGLAENKVSTACFMPARARWVGIRKLSSKSGVKSSEEQTFGIAGVIPEHHAAELVAQHIGALDN